MKFEHIMLFLTITLVFGSCKKEEQEPTLTSDFKLVLVGGDENTTVTKLGIAELSFLFYKKGELLIEEDWNNTLFMGAEILENTTGLNAFSIIQNNSVRNSLNYYCEMPNSTGHLKVRFYMMVNNVERGNSIVVDFTVTDTSTTWRAIQMPYIDRLMQGNNGSMLALGLSEYFYTNNSFNTFEKVSLPELLNPGTVDANGHFLLFNGDVLYDFDPNSKSFTSRNMPFGIRLMYVFDGINYYVTTNNDIAIEKTPGVFTYSNANFHILNKLMKSTNGQFFVLSTTINNELKLFRLDNDTTSNLTPIDITGTSFLAEVAFFNNKLYAFDQKGIFVSANLGDSWSKLCDLPMNGYLARKYKVINDKIYVSYGESVGLYYSSSLENPVLQKLKGTPFDYEFYPIDGNQVLISRRSKVQLIVPTP